MGRRSINSTKTGKFMNPTDQARKEARRKELKKNKKQRLAVRQAVLKNKDPRQIIHELEKIDQMEFSVDNPPPLSEKVLKEKRRKLKETLDRVLRLYEKEDPEYWSDIKSAECDYDKWRIMLIAHHESVKNAQRVTVDDIPLPTKILLSDHNTSQIPLPQNTKESPVKKSILKQTSAETPLTRIPNEKMKRGPPGVPPGLPPPLDIIPALSVPVMPPRIRPPIPMMPSHVGLAPPLNSAGFMPTNVFSAAPQLRQPGRHTITIEAKPQLRNLSADVTKFVPSSVRVRRDSRKNTRQRAESTAAPSAEISTVTKDDAYDLFMSEMKDLL